MEKHKNLAHGSLYLSDNLKRNKLVPKENELVFYLFLNSGSVNYFYDRIYGLRNVKIENAD